MGCLLWPGAKATGKFTTAIGAQSSAITTNVENAIAGATAVGYGSNAGPRLHRAGRRDKRIWCIATALGSDARANSTRSSRWGRQRRPPPTDHVNWFCGRCQWYRIHSLGSRATSVMRVQPL